MKNQEGRGALIIILIIAIALVLFLSKQNKNEENLPVNEDNSSEVDNMEGAEMESEMDDDSMNGEPQDLSNEQAGSYEKYSPEKVSNSEGKVVLFFKANWCPTCKALDANIKSNLSSIPSDVTILEVDYDNSTELKQKYGVTYQHTLVQVDQEGNQLAKWSGSQTLDALISNTI